MCISIFGLPKQGSDINYGVPRRVTRLHVLFVSFRQGLVWPHGQVLQGAGDNSPLPRAARSIVIYLGWSSDLLKMECFIPLRKWFDCLNVCVVCVWGGVAHGL